MTNVALMPTLKHMIGSITDQELAKAKRKAEHKLSMIIKTEGDADGVRREPWYFEMLVKEQLRSDITSAFTQTMTEIYQEIEETL